LFDCDRRIAAALVRRGANELDQCSHRINPPDISLLAMLDRTERDCLTSRNPVHAVRRGSCERSCCALQTYSISAAIRDYLHETSSGPDGRGCSQIRCHVQAFAAQRKFTIRNELRPETEEMT